MSAPRLLSPTTTSGGTPVGGSGTGGTIPKWSGAGASSTLGDSILVQDTATGPTIVLNGSTSAYSSAGRGLLSINGSASSMVGLTVGGVAAGYFGTTASSIQMIAGGSRTLQLGAANAIGMTFDAFNNVGIGTASPFTRTDSLSTRNTALGSIAAFNTMPLSVTDDTAFATGVGGGINFRAKLTSSTYNTYAAIWSSRESAINSDYRGSLVFATSDNANGWPIERARIDSSGNLILNSAKTGATIQAAGSQQGLKLPATPNNSNANTIDAYVDGGLTAGGAAFTVTPFGWTTSGGNATPTITIRYVVVGRRVTVTGRIESTGGSNWASPGGTACGFNLPLAPGSTYDMGTCVITGSAPALIGYGIAYNDGNFYVSAIASTGSIAWFSITYHMA
jgi:hypothetical protein